jgi:hypothetical protein
MQPDELTLLERQLAACRPSAAGLDADAMLFAAGRAVAERRRPELAWPAVACGFAVLALGLAGGWVLERAERVALANRLQGHRLAAEMPRPPAVTRTAELAPDSYLAARRMIDRDVDVAQVADDRPDDDGPAPPSEPVLRAWGAFLEH